MLSYFELRKGVQFILEGQPYEVLDFKQIYKAQDVAVVKTKIKNLITGNVLERTFRQSDNFQEAELEKVEIKFLYSHRGKFYFSQIKNPQNRFQLAKEKIDNASQFLKPNQVVIGIEFQKEIINITLPIKVDLKVIEAPPGIRGDRAQGGSKTVTLETGAKINTPLFIEKGDIIEVNTETEEYVRRKK